MNYKIIAYAIDFISFLIQLLGEESRKINQIILFGSIARGDDDKKSDIDLLIDVTDEKLEKKIDELKDKFYNSIKVKKYWKLLEVENEINCTIGKLGEWEELERSIIANGIVLFGKYKIKTAGDQYYLFSVTPGKDRNKNISTWRELYGYIQKVGGKIYIKKGLIEEYGGSKLARGVFIIPLEHTQKIRLFLNEKKFKFKLIPFSKEKI